MIYAPNLGWEEVEISDYLEKSLDAEDAGVSIVVETMPLPRQCMKSDRNLEQQKRIREGAYSVRNRNFFGVGLVFDGEVYRGTGRGRASPENLVI